MFNFHGPENFGRYILNPNSGTVIDGGGFGW
jgi:hypothetical protein